MANRIDLLGLKSVVAESNDALHSIEVNKPLICELDIGELLVVDPNAIEDYRAKGNVEDYVLALTRDNVQLMMNAIFQISTEVREDTVVIKLPPSTTRLPREKPCPKPTALTKWEEFRRKKGLKTQKKEKLVWDDTAKKWKPRFGFRRINSEKDIWAIPVPEGADPMEDRFQLMKTKKKERIAKNELQRLRNIQKAHKIDKVAISSVMPTEKMSPSLASKAAAVAKASTASMGKFDKKLALENEAKIKGKKRHFEDNIGSISFEKDRSLKILGELDHKRPKLNYARVVEKQIKQDIQEEIKTKKERKRGTRSSKKLGNKKAAIKMAKVNRLRKKPKGKGKCTKRR
ncbi:ribosome biogenesis regulatory protein-like [Tropilaelaps mercedesae]|uniref:Ribosome biogenesis regulatory protein n=1 Tax=Tropilaelaps mercedesae TaxID=418985 RepID=A0A1V9XU42_9ACAR|nr:ribosome biogenesis regulatory protein-like [Tropilaelaps mercedesae]